MATRKSDTSDALLAAISEARKEPGAEGSKKTLREALKHKNWLVVSEAAKVVGQNSLHDFVPELTAVWPRFVNDGAKVDPGCRAKEAALTALDQLEVRDESAFIAAIRHKQLEAIFGGRTDTAGPVRVRAVSALLRIQHPDAWLFVGELFADPDAGVRSGVAHAIGYYGDVASGCVLVHKLCAGDGDDSVLAECAAALLSLAPEFALAILKAWLGDEKVERREIAAQALGQSNRPEAIARLIEWVDDIGHELDIDIGLRALGLSRNDGARDYLLGILTRESPMRAQKALEALATHRYDEKLAARVHDAIGKNERARAALQSLAARVFRPEP